MLAALRQILPEIAVPQSHGGTIASPPLSAPVITASILVNGLSLALPLTVLQVYDRILPNASTHTLSLLILGLMAVMVLDAGLKIARAHLMGWSAASFGHRIGLAAFRRVVQAQPDKLGATPLSDHMQRFGSLGAVADFYGGQTRLLAIDIPATGVFLVLMAIIGGPVALVPVALIAIFAVLNIRRNKAVTASIEARSESDSRKYDFVIEVMSHIQTVKALALEPQMVRRYERLQRQVGECSYTAIQLANSSQNAIGLYSSIATISVVFAGALLAIGGSLSVGAVAACTLLTGQVIQPVLRGISALGEVQRTRHDVAEGLRLFDLPEQQEFAGTLEDFGEGIHVRDLSFRSKRKAGAGFEGASFAVEAGAITGILGADGSGRSTLMRILSGDLQPDSGTIRHGGHDLYGPAHTALRERISYVGPAAPLFRGTILENLTMFGCSAAPERAREAAALIGLEHDIHLLPNGYDTDLGVGVMDALPGATKQRIAIARALARDPRVLILDEANAPLDQRSEALLIEALKSLRGHMTILIVSYRPSFLKISDHLLEVADGQVSAVNPEPVADQPVQDAAKAGPDTMPSAAAPARPFSISGKLTA
ncbi:peptidase domain-containing ABC transporter [Stappia stellulata]|uniref:peptidase domain-containing ABC transporter n=1 Tax=Stappia stellulata TaxID=71235 RepID=UPI000490985B|nr:ABC transporter transmembrane domain-containing protein [Stappia stellulata]